MFPPAKCGPSGGTGKPFAVHTSRSRLWARLSIFFECAAVNRANNGGAGEIADVVSLRVTQGLVQVTLHHLQIYKRHGARRPGLTLKIAIVI